MCSSVRARERRREHGFLCLGITNVDPVEYDLLFERFLNPDRISMPDIDVDFSDDKREKVIHT